MNKRPPKSYIEEGKKIYWEPYGRGYVRIIKTGEIIRKEKFVNDKRFKDRIEADAFLDNL